MVANKRERQRRADSGATAFGRPATLRLLLALCVGAALIGPQGAAAPGAGPALLNVDVPVANEGFEGVFPGSAWIASDSNLQGGNDSWATTDYRAASGSHSVWAAGDGSQVAVWDAGEVPRVNVTQAPNQTIFFDDFEGGSFAANWTATDDDPTSGNDTWGPSKTRAFAGTTSLWAAQVGYNDELLDVNVNVSTYDNDQVSWVWRSVNLSNVSNTSEVVLEYWWWMDSESCCDYLYAVYFDGSFWNYETYDSGTSNGWTFGSVPIPSTAEQVGFLFETDLSVIYEGVYIDNISLIAAAAPAPAQPAGPFVEDFETANATGNWSASDGDAYAGRDYWGVSTARSHSGSASLWSAQVGRNSEWGSTPNADVPAYDDGMFSLAWRPIATANLSAFPSATLSFWYWLDSEPSIDYLSPMYYNQTDGWTTLDTWDGDSGGWVFASYAMPNDTERVGFLFVTDTWVEYEGAYVDDVEVRATRDDANSELRTYDNFMNSTMSRGVNLSPYALAYLEYSYWLATDTANDTLEAFVLSGTTWTTLDRRSGNSSAWQTLAFALPLNATRIGFRFVTDGAGRSEGAYIDDIRLWGVVFPVNCTAAVTAITGIEAATPFVYTVQASDGLLPYRFDWTFTDGTNVTAQSPSRTFADVGGYSANVTVTDALGQTCTATAPSVTVTHDTRAISLGASPGLLKEGRSVTVNATDARGHALDFDWSLAPSTCGALSRPRGPSVVFVVSESAGGLTCTVEASIGGVAADMTFAVFHDSAVVGLTPSVADVIEGDSLTISAVDNFGHALAAGWSASCGRVTPTSGSATVFVADKLGGQTCTVTATSLMGSNTATITVVHDTRSLTLTPAAATPLEGESQAFTATDVNGHAADVDWTVAPAECGAFSASRGPATTFTAATSAGGQTCRVSAVSGTVARFVEFTVRHDVAPSTLSPASVVVAEGGSQSFTAIDRYGHAIDASWDLSATQCGALSAATGSSVTLTVPPKAGVLTCTVRAISARVSLQAAVIVTHGAPASLEAHANVSSVVEGGSVFVEASVRDAAGHPLKVVGVFWQATCGALSSDGGASVTLLLSTDEGGQDCIATASQGDLRASVAITVLHAGPFELTVASTGEPAGPQTFVATVMDRNGHRIPDATIVWTTTCGALSSAAGPTTIFTAPGDLAGSSCRVTATSTVGISTGEVVRTETTGMPAVVPLVVALVIAGVGASLVVVRWRGLGAKARADHRDNVGRRVDPERAQPVASAPATRPAAAPALAAQPSEAPCPQCGLPVETGWAACPACGLDIVWG